MCSTTTQMTKTPMSSFTIGTILPTTTIPNWASTI
ncbi:hypothetical protein BC938DRAFT_474889 [Jimgerdemannia flammicorona]|uniref:Uncharacterized protein n=1 Tax=Jimgerdemannia flammicorona TaxID=994334 RepID=A0A433Q1B2_9FUNG|nr:hypothetical protein BC938DRAFT_474889 [Jimgerdemannia flammicorona]